MYPKYSGWWGLVVVLALAAAWHAWRQVAHAEPQPKQSSADDTAAVDVRSFGARGDGAADDTAAIQAAVDHGGCVDLPRGVYRITKPIEIRLERTGYTSLNGHGVAQLAMDGAGPAIRFVGTHDGTADPLTFHERVWRRERTPAVNGLEIIGRHAEASGIEATGTMQLTLSQLAAPQAAARSPPDRPQS